MNERGINRRPIEPPDNDRSTLMAQIEYHRGEINRHKHGVSKALQQLANLSTENLTRAEWLQEHVVRLRIEERLVNYLEEMGIYTVAQLLDTPREKLRETAGIGPLMEAQLFKALAEIGFVRAA